MSLLDHLWDDTVAGPQPESGLGKLRKQPSLGFRSNSGKETDVGSVRSYGEDVSSEVKKVTRTIMIVKPPGYLSASPPVSPAGSTPPVSPFSGGSKDMYRFRRRSASDAYEKANVGGPRSPRPPNDV